LRTPQLPDDLRPILLTLTSATGENGLDSMATAAALLRDVALIAPQAPSTRTPAAVASAERSLLGRAIPFLLGVLALVTLVWYWLSLP
jgi:hypothetical protein